MGNTLSCNSFKCNNLGATRELNLEQMKLENINGILSYRDNSNYQSYDNLDNVQQTSQMQTVDLEKQNNKQNSNLSSSRIKTEDSLRKESNNQEKPFDNIMLISPQQKDNGSQQNSMKEFQEKQFHSISFGKQESDRKSTSRFQGEDTSEFKQEESNGFDQILKDNVLQNIEQYDIAERKQQNIENFAKKLQQKQYNLRKTDLSDTSENKIQGRYSSFQSQQLGESEQLDSDNFEFEEEEDYQRDNIPVVDLNEQKIQDQFHFDEISFKKQIESEKMNQGINAQHFEWTLQKTVESDVQKPQESYEFQEVHINFNFNQDSERLLNFQNKIPALQEIKSFKQVNGERQQKPSNQQKSLHVSFSTNNLDYEEKQQIDQDVKKSMKLNSPYSMKANIKKKRTLSFKQSNISIQSESAADQLTENSYEIPERISKDQQNQTMLTESSQDPLSKSLEKNQQKDKQLIQSQQNLNKQQPSPLASNRLKNLELINDISDQNPSSSKKVKKVTKSKSAISLLQNKKSNLNMQKQEPIYQSMTQESNLSRQSSSASIQGLSFITGGKDQKKAQIPQIKNSLNLEENQIKLSQSFDSKLSQKSPQKNDQKKTNLKTPPKSGQKKVGSPSQKQKTEAHTEKLQISPQVKDSRGQKTVKQASQIKLNQPMTQSQISQSAQSPDLKSKKNDQSNSSFNIQLIQSQEQENSLLITSLEQTNDSIQDQMLESNEFDIKFLVNNESPNTKSNQRKKADSLQPKKVSQIAKKSVGKPNTKVGKSSQKKSSK